jgi:hypothetical protein
MNRHFGVAAFFVGLIVVAWVGFGYAGSNPLALTMTVLIGAFYLMGALELRRFHQATSSLTTALAALPESLPNLGDWLMRLHPSLQSPVRLRIEGERVGLPGPSMTPYLVGLLVLLGMLGTFLGMVVTLQGAVMALESTTDLPTIRAALAAPVKGLGLAFGTSVAGVAASAMLGLVSALCRRERLQAAQDLDARIVTTLRVHSLAHQRQETLKTLRYQAGVIPEVLEKMQAMMAQMERRAEGLDERLLASQERFQRQAQAAYSDLAASVDRSLRQSLTESARLAGATIQPVVEATMTGITRETAAFQEKLAGAAQVQLDGLAARFGTTVGTVADVWKAALAQHQRTSESLSGGLQQSLASVVQGLEMHSASLLASVERAHAALRADAAASDERRLAASAQSLEAMAAALQREWRQAGALAGSRQEQICKTLEQTAQDIHARAEAHARSTIAELSRLIETASEAPRVAAEVAGLLRQQLSDSLAKDNELLAERSRIMGTLGTLLDVVNRGATEQRGAIDTLVASSAAMLQQLGAQFTERVEAESLKMSTAATQMTGSAVEVSSLSEAFGHAVQLFGESSEALAAQLQRIEGALSKSTARSDEQLAYYVAQAREIIDLSISAQKQIVDDLRQIARQQAPLASVAA